MRFSKSVLKRYEEARYILSVCQESTTERATHCRNMRNVYMRGAGTGIECKDNRIKPIIDQLSAFLYAPESVAFWADLGPAALSNWVEMPAHVIEQISKIQNVNQIPQDKLEQLLEQINFDRLDAVIDTLNDSWHDSDIDNITGIAVSDSLVEGCSIMHLHVEPHRVGNKNSIVAYQIDPSNFGVWRNGVNSLAQQQAFCHTSNLSLPEIKLRIYNHPQRNEILRGLEPSTSDAISTSRVFPTSATATSITGAPLGVFTGQFDYVPRNSAQEFRVHELYAWDDIANDYRIFQISGNYVILENFLGGIRDDSGQLIRAGMGIKGRPPFVKICPYPLRNYFWGWSLVDGLLPLQNWYSHRLNEFDTFFGKTLNRPKAVLGMGGLDDEIKDSLNTEGGVAFLGQPGATLQEMTQNVPPESLTILASIQEMFYESASLRPSLFGRQESGTRSEGMLAGLLRVAAAPTRKTALIVERQLEELASLLYIYKREFQDDELPGPDGTPFLLREFPEDARVKVDGHSSCPLFAEDHLKMAEALWRMGVLTPTIAVDLIHPPQTDRIKFSQRKIEMAKMIANQVVKQQQELKRQGQAGAK